MVRDDDIATAGVYLLCRGLLAFAVGPSPAGDRLAVIRLGGHREAGETAAQCVARELWEEAGVRISLLDPPATYRATPTGWGAYHLERLDPGASLAPAPLLVTPRERSGQHSVTYLAVPEEAPVPSSEVAGILLLDVSAVRLLTGTPITLGDFLATGGRAVLRAPLDPSLPLSPFAQLQILPQLLALHPDLPDLGRIARTDLGRAALTDLSRATRPDLSRATRTDLC